jgi:formiminotetrahydrofolate cyclodeaminase
MLTGKRLTDLLDAFSSPEPTPGGGSAAALAGALGASLLAMVAGLAKTRHQTAEDRAVLDAARADLLRCQATLASLVDQDAAAYDQVVAAYRQPKLTDADREARRAAVQVALRRATEVQIEVLRTASAALHLGEAVAERGHPSARSDVGVGGHLLLAAVSGARLNAGINLEAISDRAASDELRRQAADAGRDADARGARVLELSGPKRPGL